MITSDLLHVDNSNISHFSVENIHTTNNNYAIVKTIDDDFIDVNISKLLYYRFKYPAIKPNKHQSIYSRRSIYMIGDTFTRQLSDINHSAIRNGFLADVLFHYPQDRIKSLSQLCQALNFGWFNQYSQEVSHDFMTAWKHLDTCYFADLLITTHDFIVNTIENKESQEKAHQHFITDLSQAINIQSDILDMDITWIAKMLIKPSN